MTIPKSYTTSTVNYSEALAVEYIGDDKNYEEYLHNIFPNALYIKNYDDKVSLYADYEETSSTSTSKTYRVTLNIKSDVDIVGLQANVMLSYYLNMVDNSFNYTNGSLYAAAGNKFSTSSLLQASDGSYLLMINPPAKKVIPPGDYTIGTFDVTTKYPEGNHYVDIRNGLALEPIPNNDNDWYYHYMDSYYLRLSEIIGDVNRDRRVDISDVVAVINTMAGDRKFVGRTDVNTDTKTDIADIVSIINIMANGTDSPYTPRE